MSTIKLPPPSFYHKHEEICGNEVGPPTPFWNQTAVEEAVRQALAAQVPVAWVIDARRGLSDPQFCWGNPDGVYKSLYVPLALIPEKDHG